MEFIQNLAAAVLPPLFVIYYMYKNDLYEKEPHGLIFKTFIVGCLVVLPVLLFSLDESFYPNKFLFALFGVAFFEEGFKFIFLRFYNYNKKDFNEPYYGIFMEYYKYGLALAENIFYVLGIKGGRYIAILRCFTAIPLHATCEL